MHLRIFVTLPNDTPFALFEVARPPRTIQIMERHKPVLHVCPRAHFGRAAHQYAHLSAAYLCKQLLLPDLRVGFMNKRDLAFGNAFGDQLLPNVIVDGEAPIPFGRGEVAKNELGELVCVALPIDPRNVLYA